jgi:hypothetical protein
MKNEGHKGVRMMKSKRAPQDKGTLATIEVRCDDNGLWQINSDPCGDDAAAMRLTLECIESLAYSRDSRNDKAGLPTRRARLIGGDLVMKPSIPEGAGA